ncbi:Calx-beta domain-containing protein [Synechococcus sp. W2B2]|uniref:Calx-beta domain-containing protein n=1 Tax=unclassified Synechococcus TaxID=2626047 RepID=UPI0002F49AC8|nr:Calx-beta domain-containing protein [Synechococcus sp. WH 7805]
MTINLTDRQAAIATDAFGITYVVWVDNGFLWQAIYDDNAEEWKDARTITSIGQQSVLGLNLVTDPSLINLDNGATTAPGLAVVWQQGELNNSEFFYITADYDANGQTKWQDKGEQLTNDQVGDLEPQSIVYPDGNSANVRVGVIGTKVDIERAADLGIKEDTDLYSINLPELNKITPDIPSNLPTLPNNFPAIIEPANKRRNPANYIPQTINNGLINTGLLNSDNSSNTSSSNSGFQGFGASIDAAIDFSISDIFKAWNTDASVRPEILKKLVKSLLDKIDYSGALKGGKDFNGDSFLEQDGTLTYSLFEGESKGPVFRKDEVKDPSSINNVVSISGKLDSTYTFNNGQTGSSSLSEIDQDFTVSLDLKIPLLAPYEDGVPGITVNADFSAGSELSVTLIPKKNSSYAPQSFAIELGSLGLELGQEAGIAASIAYATGQTESGDSLKNAIAAAIAESSIISLADSITQDTLQGFEETLTIGFPVLSGTIKGKIGIKNFLDLTFNGGLDFSVNFGSEPDFVTAGIPLGAGVKFGPISLGFSFDPSWQWNITSGGSSVNGTGQTTSLGGVNQQNSLNLSQASVDGSLLTLDLGSELNELPQADDFTVTITRADGTSKKINPFGVIPTESGSGVILQLKESIAPSINFDFRENDKNPSPTQNQITVSFTNNGNIKSSSGATLGNIVDLPVSNNTPQELSSIYSPISGNNENYSTEINPALLGDNVAADLSEDSSPALSLTDNNEVLVAWVTESANIAPIAGIGILNAAGTISQIQLNFINQITNTPSLDQFSIADTQGNQYEINGIRVNGNTVQLNLTNNVASGTQLIANYQLSSDNANNLVIRDQQLNTNIYVEEFENLLINNPTVSISTGSLDAAELIGTGNFIQRGSNLITLAFNQPLFASSTNFEFVIRSQGIEYITESVRILGNTVQLVITPPDGENLIGQGDIATVSYTGTSLSGSVIGSSPQPIKSFQNQRIDTATEIPTTVIQTWIGTPPKGENANTSASLETIPGSSGFNFTPAAALDQNGNNVLVWVNTKTSNLKNKQIPGEFYSETESQEILNTIDQSNIFYSIYDPTQRSWSLAEALSTQPGADGRVAIGPGPENNLIAAWINYESDKPTIYWSELTFSNGTPNWSKPEIVISSAQPDETSQLTIELLNGQPAIFWTETQPTSYAELTLGENPVLYYRLSESSGPILNNIGSWGDAGNGMYSAGVQLNQIGALEDPTTKSGDPNRAAKFEAGTSASINNAIQIYRDSFTIDFWFKFDETPNAANPISLVNLSDVAQISFTGNELELSLGNANSNTSINSSTSTNNPSFIKDQWYYVTAVYDATAQTAGLFINGENVGILENLDLFQPDSRPVSTIQLADENNQTGVYLDEVAYYASALSFSDVLTSDLQSPSLTGAELLEIISNSNAIGNKYNSQFVDPLPPEPNTFYVVYDTNKQSWETTENQIVPLYRPQATALNDERKPRWDVVSSTAANTNNTYVNPNGLRDTLFRVILEGQQGKTITGIELNVDNTNYATGSQTTSTSNQLGLIIGNQLINTLNPDSNEEDLTYTILGSELNIALLVDNGTDELIKDSKAGVTILFDDGSSQTINALQGIGGDETSLASNFQNPTIEGVATVTEANDSQLSLIDSGFIINTQNVGIGYRLATGDFNGDGLSDVAVGNRGFIQSETNTTSGGTGGTVQILLNGGDVLMNQETTALGSSADAQGDPEGNPGGFLITGITDKGEFNGDFSLSLASGDINNDGADDLIIGAPNEPNGGAVYVVYGSSEGGKTVDVTNLTEETEDVDGYKISNPNGPEGLFGYAIAVGNFDGQQGADIAISDPNYINAKKGKNAGAVYIYPSNSSLPLKNNPIHEGEADDLAGLSLTTSKAGDGSSSFSGSTTNDDLIIGAPGVKGSVDNQWNGIDALSNTNSNNDFITQNYPDQSNVALGEVYVFTYDANENKPTLNGVLKGLQIDAIQNNTASDLLTGSALVSGDWDGDGQNDLGIAAPKGSDNAGIIYLSQGGQKPNEDSTPTTYRVSKRLVGGLAYGQAGQDLANAGDLNGDTYNDLLVTSNSGASGTGQGYVVFGEANLFDDPELSLSATSADNKKVLLLNGSQPSQVTGTAASGIGDINKDGIDDLLITAPNQTQLYAVFGQPFLRDDGSIKLADISADNGFVTDGLLFQNSNNEPLIGTGLEVSILGDVNGDGFADVLSAGSPRGSIITFGKTTQAIIDDATGSDQLIVSVENGLLKSSFAIGDFNGDGLADSAFIDSTNTFYVLNGENDLSVNGTVSLSTANDSIPNLAAVNAASAVGDLNSDGFDDLLITKSGTKQLILGNTKNQLEASSVDFDSNGNLVFGGIGDINGDGFADLGGGNFLVDRPEGKIKGNGSTDYYLGNNPLGGESNTFKPNDSINPPSAPLSGELSESNPWQTILGEDNPTIEDQRIGDGSTVSFAEYKGFLYVAFRNDGPTPENNNPLIIGRSRDGVNWNFQELGSTVRIATTPSLAVFNETLYLAYLSVDEEVILAVGEDAVDEPLGVSFPTDKTVTLLSEDIKGAPTLLATDDNLFTFYISTTKNQIEYIYSDTPNNASSWSDPSFVEGPNISTQSAGINGKQTGVSATINSDGNILLAYFANKGPAKNKFNTIIGANPEEPASINWQNFQQIAGQSTQAPPSVISIDNTAYLFFNGPGDINKKNTINYVTSTDGGVTWTPNDSQVPNQITEETTTPVFFNENLYLGFNAAGVNNYINISNSNPLFDANDTQEFGRQFNRIGDFNGDGIEDLAILATGFISNLGVNFPGTNSNSSSSINENNRGALLIYYGGITPTTTSTPDVVLAAPVIGTWVDQEGENPNYTSLTAGTNSDTSNPDNAASVREGSIRLSRFDGIGDINGDGFDDVIISSFETNINATTDTDPNSDNNSAPNRDGLSYVVFGGDNWQNPASTPFDLGSLNNNQTKTSGQPGSTNDQGFIVLGLTTGSQAGISLSGGGDVNGDGLDDFMIGAPGLAKDTTDSLSYTLFGSDFTAQINQTGTIGNDVMVGSPTGESFIANIGNDEIYSGGGLDVVYAGPGNDYITINDPNFRRIDGGTGEDILTLEGYNGQEWDFTTLAPGNRLKNIEAIISQGYGENTLKLNSLAVTNLSSTNTLILAIDQNDRVELSQDFSLAGTVTLINKNYAEYTSSVSAARVLIDQLDVTPTFTVPDTLNPRPIASDSSLQTATALSLGEAAPQRSATTSTEAGSAEQVTDLLITNPVVNESEQSVSFVITRTGDLNQTIQAIYRSDDRDGKAGSRYLPVAGQLTFAPGESSKTVTVPIPNDQIFTGTRQFSLVVGLVSNDPEAMTGQPAPAFTADANGEVIRGWNYVRGDFSGNVMGSFVEFSTTTTKDSARIDLSIKGVSDYNDYLSFDPSTQSYQSLIGQDNGGARFIVSDSTESSTPEGVQLLLEDGEQGDADGVVNGLTKNQGFVGRTIPGLIKNNNDLFLVPTASDGKIQLRLIDSPDQDYELGWIEVDDVRGRIDGLLSTDPGYEAAALARKEIIFKNQENASSDALSASIANTSLQSPGSLVQTERQFFGELSSTQLNADRHYMLYSKIGTTTKFSINESPTIESDSRGYHNLTFQGITAEIGTNAVVAPGLLNQDVSVQTSISRAAGFENLVALYKVDDLTGGLDTNNDQTIDLRPEDLGYAREALIRAADSLTGVTLTTPDNFSRSEDNIVLMGGTIYGMVLIPNATIEDVLDQNPQNRLNNGPNALFSFSGANPDGLSHVARLGSDLFGFEDIIGSKSDRDFNDIVLNIDYL